MIMWITNPQIRIRHYKCRIATGVRDGSPITIEYLNKIIDILETHKIEIPNLNDFEKFTYESADTDWIVWGEKIEIEIIEKILNNNKISSLHR